MDDDDSENDTGNLFQEPDDYYQPEKPPTQVQHTTLSGQVLNLNLVGSSPLWGHLLWNAGRTIAAYLEQRHATLLHARTVLELGAGAGLPSLVGALHGAALVVVTDYPDAELIANLRANIRACEPFVPRPPPKVVAEGYLWGADTAVLTDHLVGLEAAGPGEASARGFDLLILADLLFNHSEHGKLVTTIQKTLRRGRDAQALVFFTPYRPWLLQKDLAFFDLAAAGGFRVEKIMETVMEKVMFEEDPGDELLRRTVFGYKLTWAEDEL